MKSRVFEQEALIRFSHCDPAGIVFFPQYLILFNGLIEDWFNQCLQVGYEKMIIQRRIGVPTVALSCEFSTPSRMGEQVTLGLSVERVGTKSVGLNLFVRYAEQYRVKATLVFVTTELDTNISIPIPDDIRAAILHQHFETLS